MDDLLVRMALQEQRIRRTLLTVPFQPDPKPRVEQPTRKFQQWVWNGTKPFEGPHGTVTGFKRHKCKCRLCYQAYLAYKRRGAAKREDMRLAIVMARLIPGPQES